MANKLMNHFEQDLLPQVIELLRQTPKPTPETGLLAYITEQIGNVVYFDEVTNCASVNIDMPEFMQVAGRYANYINYYATADYFLNTSLSFASLIYDKDIQDKVQQTNDLLTSFITNYISKSDVITHLNTPEAVKLDIIIKELQKYKGKVSADNVDFIIKSIYAVKTITQKIYLDVLRSLGFGEVAIIYIDLCNGTNKERSRYNTKLYDEVIENMLNNGFYTSLALRNIVPPGVVAEFKDSHANTFKNVFVDWFKGGLDPTFVANAVNLLITHPTIDGIIAFQTLILPLGERINSYSITNDSAMHIAVALATLANAAGDIHSNAKIIEEVREAFINRQFERIPNMYDQIVSKLNFADTDIVDLFLISFLHWVFDESRYIRFTTESTDKAYVDKQKILNVVATSDLSDIDIRPYFLVVDDMVMYVNSFLGSNSDLANKVIANLGKYDSKELDLLQAVGKANQSDDLTEEQHIMLERLIPKDVYANFIFAVYERRQDLYNAFLVN